MIEKITIFQKPPAIGHLAHNFAQITQAISQAKDEGASVIVFPELATCGYSPKDLLLQPDFVEQTILINEKIAQLSTPDFMIIWGGLSKNTGKGKPLFNSIFAALDGEVVCTAHKSHLPTYDVFGEARYFEAGSPDQAIPVLVGPNGSSIALSICEDLWGHPALYQENDELRARPKISPYEYSSELFSPTKTLGVDTIIHILASPYCQDKPELRYQELKKIAVYENANIVFCNQIAAVDDVLFDGHSGLVTQEGKVFTLPAFESGQINLWEQPQFELHQINFKTDPEIHYKAILFGMREYFKNTGFRKALLGLSGGVDSALVVTLAVKALGKENVSALLMPGPYSSEHSVSDAMQVASSLGITHQLININQTFDSFLTCLNPTQTRLQDLAEQNLQARIRGTLLMTLANRQNALVLATSNKSELAMGYSTLYGDSCGALAPIGDLYKHQVYALCNWINQNIEPCIPQSILDKAPSAELAPNQKDEDSLGPYAELDPKLEAFLERNQTIEPQLERSIHRAEYKRRQFPIILKLSQKAFGSGWQHIVSQQYQG